jgi:oligoendopeptidase F
MAATKLEERIVQLEKDFSRRLSELEAEVSRLKQEQVAEPKKQRPWWEEIRGTFKNDPAYEEAMRYGREYRESLRPKDNEETDA